MPSVLAREVKTRGRAQSRPHRRSGLAEGPINTCLEAAFFCCTSPDVRARSLHLTTLCLASGQRPLSVCRTRYSTATLAMTARFWCPTCACVRESHHGRKHGQGCACVGSGALVRVLRNICVHYEPPQKKNQLRSLPPYHWCDDLVVVHLCGAWVVGLLSILVVTGGYCPQSRPTSS